MVKRELNKDALTGNMNCAKNQINQAIFFK